MIEKVFKKQSFSNNGHNNKMASNGWSSSDPEPKCHREQCRRLRSVQDAMAPSAVSSDNKKLPKELYLPSAFSHLPFIIRHFWKAFLLFDKYLLNIWPTIMVGQGSKFFGWVRFMAVFMTQPISKRFCPRSCQQYKERAKFSPTIKMTPFHRRTPKKYTF